MAVSTTGQLDHRVTQSHQRLIVNRRPSTPIYPMMATSGIPRPIASDVSSNVGSKDAGSQLQGNKRKRLKRTEKLQAAEDVGATLDEIMKSKSTESIETAILYMMHRYNFDFDHLKKIIECAWPHPPQLWQF